MQLYFALLFNCNIQGFFTGQIYSVNDASTTKKFCVPGINCYSCPGAVGACPLGSLQGSFSSKNHSTIYYVAGSLALFAILLGRMICGWLCPFGLIQELLFKIKSPKLKKSPVTRILSFLKYVILVFFVGIVPITYALRGDPLPAFCKFICPAGTIEGGLIMLSNKFNGGLFEDYYFACTHLSLTEEDRLASLEIIGEIAQQYTKPFYLAGDLNDVPGSPFLTSLQAKFNILNDSAAQTFPAPQPDRALDYIAIWKETAPKLEVVAKEVVNEPVASDHRPVVVVVKY